MYCVTIVTGCSCQPHVMALLHELDLATYNQYTHGKKLLQIGSDTKIRSFTGDIPTLSWLALIDLHFFIVKVYSWWSVGEGSVLHVKVMLSLLSYKACCTFWHIWHIVTLSSLVKWILANFCGFCNKEFDWMKVEYFILTKKQQLSLSVHRNCFCKVDGPEFDVTPKEQHWLVKE